MTNVTEMVLNPSKDGMDRDVEFVTNLPLFALRRHRTFAGFAYDYASRIFVSPLQNARR